MWSSANVSFRNFLPPKLHSRAVRESREMLKSFANYGIPNINFGDIACGLTMLAHINKFLGKISFFPFSCFGKIPLFEI